MIVLAVVVGYLLGSIPTAGFLGRAFGLDLRTEGSGNPGAANALRTAGPRLAAIVLLVEAAKGYGAVWLGYMIAGESGALAGGLGAVAGNVYNVWYRFGGGKGLGITLGVLAALWPLALAPVVTIIALGAVITRSAGSATLIAILGLVVLALLWSVNTWPTGGLIPPDREIVLLAIGLGALVFWRHWRDSPLSAPSPG
jgi:glycerol-3-phosphate acyltransferase PlsY